jgi:hypothetical protein
MLIAYGVLLAPILICYYLLRVLTGARLVQEEESPSCFQGSGEKEEEGEEEDGYCQDLEEVERVVKEGFISFRVQNLGFRVRKLIIQE